MRCNQCGSDNLSSNRFCGQCGSPLADPLKESAKQAAGFRKGVVLNSFHEEVERQLSELNEIQSRPNLDEIQPEKSGFAKVAPLSTLATSPPEFGPESPATRLSSDVSTATTPARSTSQWESSATNPKYAEQPITGPSFLGLSDPDPASNPSLAYLYDEEDRRPGHGRFWGAALIGLAFLGFMVYMWRQNPNWHSGIVASAQQLWLRGQGRTGAASPSVPDPAQSASRTNSAGGEVRPRAADALPPTPAQPPAGGRKPEGMSVQPTRPTDSMAGFGTSPHDNSELPKQRNANTGPVIADAGTLAPPKANVEHVTASAVPKEAVQQGDARSREPGSALVSRADAYLYGRGVPKSCEQAMVYLRAAADRGNATARSKLGGLYATGSCVPLDRARAYNWFTLARRAGDRNVWIDRNMAMLWSQMTPDEKARTTHTAR